MKSLKKLDIVIIISLLLLSFVPNLVFFNTFSKNYSSTYASIKLEGDLYDNIPLSSFKGEKKLTIKGSHGENTILVKDNSIEVVHADCKDSLCIKQGSASKVGQTIVCLPNELIIEIKGDEEDSSDDMILSH